MTTVALGLAPLTASYAACSSGPKRCAGTFLQWQQAWHNSSHNGWRGGMAGIHTKSTLMYPTCVRSGSFQISYAATELPMAATTAPHRL